MTLYEENKNLKRLLQTLGDDYAKIQAMKVWDQIDQDAKIRRASFKGYWTGFFWGALAACVLGTVAILLAQVI